MKFKCTAGLLVVLLSAACAAAPPPSPAASSTPQPTAGVTPTASPTSLPSPSPTRRPTPAPPTKIPATPTDEMAPHLGVTIAGAEAAFAEYAFTFSPPAAAGGVQTVKGSNRYDNRIEFRALGDWIAFAEASIPNRGPQTNPGSLYTFLETFNPDPGQQKWLVEWFERDAPVYAEGSPKLETSIAIERGIFFTYKYNAGYTRIILQAYTIAFHNPEEG